MKRGNPRRLRDPVVVKVERHVRDALHALKEGRETISDVIRRLLEHERGRPRNPAPKPREGSE